MMPPGSKSPVYRAFSSDLSLAILSSSDSPPLSPTVSGGGYQVLYSRSLPGGGYLPLFGATPPNRSSNEFGTAHTDASLEPLTYAGSSADRGHLLFEANDALTATATTDPPTAQQNDLYDSHAGVLSLVNVLPGGAADPGASFGYPAPPGITGPPDFSHVISADGSRVFWTDQSTGRLYLRQNPASAEECTEPGEPSKACTIPVSVGAAHYWTATPDGRYAYYTEKGELWRFDAQAETREALAGPGAAIQGVVGLNETGSDGSYLYFVAEGALAPGAELRTCRESLTSQGQEEEAEGKLPPGSGCNLYLYHAGSTIFISALAAKDDAIGFLSDHGIGEFGDWQPALSNRTVALTPDGRDLAFLSTQRLTAYDGAGMAEVYRYDTAAPPGRALSCLSCGPGAAPPPISGASSTQGAAAYLTVGFDPTHSSRSISNDGSRVFFNSQEPLVSADTNAVQDAYEWESSDAGSCTPASATFSQASGGCLYLLSGGTDPFPSFFIDASANGADAFLATSERLAPADRNGNTDLYDARSEGGFPAPPQPQICAAESCKPNPQEPPAKTTPSTDTFHEPQQLLPKCRKGFVLKHGHCARKHKPRTHRKRSHVRHPEANPGVAR